MQSFGLQANGKVASKVVFVYVVYCNIILGIIDSPVENICVDAGGNWASGFIGKQAAKASVALEKAGLNLQERITPNEQATNVSLPVHHSFLDPQLDP